MTQKHSNISQLENDIDLSVESDGKTQFQNELILHHHVISHTGAYDDPNGSHISIEVTSALFEGKRPVQRQQLVYKALWEGTCYQLVSV